MRTAAGTYLGTAVNFIVGECAKPQYTDYLFFFAAEDGHHLFSKTYAEHVRKQKKP